MSPRSRRRHRPPFSVSILQSPLGQPPPASVSEPYKRASEELRASVRVGDSTVVHDTFTLASSLLYDRTRVWALLDDVSLRAFATALPPPAPAPSTSAASAAAAMHTHAEMAWFATVNVFSLGAVIANRLELSLMTRFRQWAEANGTLARVRVASTSAAELPTPTFPNAVLAVSPALPPGGGSALLMSGDAGSAPSTAAAASAAPRPPVAPQAGGSAGGLGLISKHHLAVFWDSLDREERLKIVIGNDLTGAAAMVHGSQSGGSGVGAAAGPFGPGSGLRFAESGGGSSAKSVTGGGGGSAKSVSGGKSRRRGGGAAAQRAAAAGGVAATARMHSGSTDLGRSAPSLLEQDTLGPLPQFAKSGGPGAKSTPPLAPKLTSPGGARPLAPPAVVVAAASAGAASSEGAASETATYATATLQVSVGGGRLTSSCASATYDDDARPALSSAGAVSRLVVPATPLASGSCSAAAVYSGQVSESGDIDESMGHSVGYSGQGPLAEADLFSQDPEQLRHMWPFCLVDKDGVTVVQVRTLYS